MTFMYHQREFLLLIIEAFLGGACMGVIYDAMRISRMMVWTEQGGAVRLYEKKYPLIGAIVRKKKRHSKEYMRRAVLIIQDILFMLIFTFVILMLLFFLNDGRFRPIVIVVAFLGLWCYLYSIGRLVIRASEMIIFILRFLLAYAFYFIMLPIRSLCRVFKLVSLTVCRRISEQYAKAVIEKEADTFYNKIMKEAECGFISDNNNKYKSKKGISTCKRNGGRSNAKGKAQKKV